MKIPTDLTPKSPTPPSFARYGYYPPANTRVLALMRNPLQPKMEWWEISEWCLGTYPSGDPCNHWLIPSCICEPVEIVDWRHLPKKERVSKSVIAILCSLVSLSILAFVFSAKNTKRITFEYFGESPSGDFAAMLVDHWTNKNYPIYELKDQANHPIGLGGLVSRMNSKVTIGGIVIMRSLDEGN